MTLKSLRLTIISLWLLTLPRGAEAGCKLFFTDTKELLCLAQQGETCKSEATLVGVDGKTRPATALLKGLPEDSCDVDSDRKLEELATKLSAGKPTIAPMICVPDKLGKCSFATDKGELQFSAKASKKTIKYSISMAGKEVKSGSVKCKHCDSISVPQLSFLKDSGALFIWIDGLSVPENNPPSSEYFYRVVQLVPTALPQPDGAPSRELLSKAGVPAGTVGTCDRAGLGKTLADLARADPAMAPTIAAKGVATNCAGALPASLVQALEAIPAVDPSMKETMAMKGASQLPDLWRRACPKGSTVLSTTAGMDRALRARTMLQACEVVRAGWARPNELSQAKGIPVAAILTYRALVEARLESKIARLLARDLAGIPTSLVERRKAASLIIASDTGTAPPQNADTAAAKAPLDQAKERAVGLLNRLWAGSLTAYESHSKVKQSAFSKFPGGRTSIFTPDCCKEKGACPSPSLWNEEPWHTLNFAPAPKDVEGMRIDYVSTGEGRTARFLAVVAIDVKCSGNPIYLSREGHIDENGDLAGNYHPFVGTTYPQWTVSKGP